MGLFAIAEGLAPDYEMDMLVSSDGGFWEVGGDLFLARGFAPGLLLVQVQASLLSVVACDSLVGPTA